MSGLVYRLYLEDGGDVGTFTTAASDWKSGDWFFDSQHRQWRLLSIAPAEGDRCDAISVVEPIDKPIDSDVD